MRPTSLLSLTVLLAALPLPSFAAPYCGLTPPKNLGAQNTGTTTNNQNSNNSTDDFVAAAWYAGWEADKYPPSSLSWFKYTHMTFSFATTANDGSLFLDDPSTQALPTFVQTAQDNGVKALVSIGGWTGSQFFSIDVSDTNRTQFVDTVLSFATQHKLDGLDFDWEYPASPNGMSCNIVSANDSANFLAFLQALRADSRGQKLYLSAAVGPSPFLSSDQATPMSDVSGFAKVLDHIAIMNYDTFGAWSETTGPNAPLADSCAPSDKQVSSATTAVKAWTAAGFPANQIVLGVAAYGHMFTVPQATAVSNDQVQLYTTFDKVHLAIGPDDDQSGANTTDSCGVSSGPGGVIDFIDMVNQGYLTSDGKAASGVDYFFDNCTQTPFVYDSKNQTMISYDDATSFAAKGKFINDNDLLGFAMWYASADSDDILLDSISDAMGIEQDCS